MSASVRASSARNCRPSCADAKASASCKLFSPEIGRFMKAAMRRAEGATTASNLLLLPVTVLEGVITRRVEGPAVGYDADDPRGVSCLRHPRAALQEGAP